MRRYTTRVITPLPPLPLSLSDSLLLALLAVLASSIDAVETGLAYGAASKKRPATTPANLPTRGVEARASSSRAGHGRATTAQHKTRDAPPATWPAIDPTTGRRAGLVPRTVASLGHYRIAVQRRNGSGESFVMIPRIPHTIWFAGTGTNRADWSTVPGATASWLTQLQVGLTNSL